MQDFAAKRRALFECLDEASKELEGTALFQNTSDSSTIEALHRSNNDEVMIYRHGRPVSVNTSSMNTLQHMRGKESIFKKPELPIGRCLKPRRAPDYQLNPHKWKKYSLEDVDISDHTNTAAAFSFLKQIDEQREAANSTDDDGTQQSEQKIEFRKSSKLKRNLKMLETTDPQDAELDGPKLRGSKVVMPEYVVGQRPKQQKVKRNLAKGKRQRAAGTLMLSHLQYVDDD